MKIAKTTFDISGDIGGPDADEAILPHFKAIKRACKGIVFDGEPFTLFMFILRVDGSVRRFGFTGVDNVQVDRKMGCLSIDIGLQDFSCGDLRAVIVDAMRQSPKLVQSVDQGKSSINPDALSDAVETLISAYLSEDIDE